MKARTILLIPLIFAIIGAFKLMDYNLYFPKDILRTSQTNLVKNGEQYLSTKVINKLPKSKLLVHFVDEKEEKNLKYNVLVVKKDGEYRVVNELKKGEDVLVLTGETITEDTTFVLKGDTLYIK